MFRKGLMLKEIFLKNSSGTELKINLWENAIQLMDNAITYATSVPVLVVTSLTVRSYYDKYFLNSTSATKIYVNLEIPEVLELQNRNISMLQASSSVEHNMKDRSLRNRKTLSQILHMLNGDSVGQVFTCTAIINDIVHDYAPFYKSCTKIGCRKKVIDKANTTPESRRYGFTANKVFQVDYKLDSLQIQEDIEQVTEPSQILNDTFQAQLHDNMHQNSSTLMKEKQLPFERSTDIPNSSNKKNRTDKTYKRKAYVAKS
ncbi:hypothetical protein IFM89_010308 [Coptis chinensis]|uniref:Uncharacterized protein n=1 Tax=Coptis chinensis TaxID=261450 RepID=A0A835HV51_9MAGN|nr:hypothetical protein IFM89_010308 [Coptis chinensis]